MLVAITKKPHKKYYQKLYVIRQKFLFFILLLITIIQPSLQMSTKSLVVGATGATGRHVVQMLLDKGQQVIAVARSKETMEKLLTQKDYGNLLEIYEAPILDISSEDLMKLTKDCTNIFCCLGHNLTFKGVFGKPRDLVTESVRRLTSLMPSSCKFILMGTEAVEHPDGKDPVRSLGARFVLTLLHYLLPPHIDNEMATEFMYKKGSECKWVVVRPTALIDENVAAEKYVISERLDGTLFGANEVSRSNVAHFMVELATNDSLFDKYECKMPFIKHK